MVLIDLSSGEGPNGAFSVPHEPPDFVLGYFRESSDFKLPLLKIFEGCNRSTSLYVKAIRKAGAGLCPRTQVFF